VGHPERAAAERERVIQRRERPVGIVEREEPDADEAIVAGAAGDGVWGSGPGWFITTRRTDDGPGATEYHSDGTVQGGWDLGQWNCEPSGVTRDQAPRNIYLTCPSPDGGTGYLFRFDQSGSLLHAWTTEGSGIAVTPEGKAAFIVSPDGTSMSRYDLDPPEGG